MPKPTRQAKPTGVKKHWGKTWVKVLVVVLVVGALAGGFWAYRQYGPSKVKSQATKAQLQQASNDLKSVNLAGIKSSVETVKSVQSGYKK